MPDWVGFITRIATAIGGRAGGTKERRRSVIRTAGVMFRLFREYKIDSIRRIEEATVREVEAEAFEACADAQKRVAEAAEIQARAALTRAEADLVLAKAAALSSNAEAKRIEAEANAESKRIKAIGDARTKLIEAVAKLKRAGGSFAIDESEIKKLLGVGADEFPDDKIIADAASNAEVIDPQKSTE